MRIYTVEDLAELLDCSPKTIYSQVGQGAIPHGRVGRLIRFHADVIEAWLKDGHGEPAREEAP